MKNHQNTPVLFFSSYKNYLNCKKKILSQNNYSFTILMQHLLVFFTNISLFINFLLFQIIY